LTQDAGAKATGVFSCADQFGFAVMPLVELFQRLIHGQHIDGRTMNRRGGLGEFHAAVVAARYQAFLSLAFFTRIRCIA
jgi:hypothetical protein